MTAGIAVDGEPSQFAASRPRPMALSAVFTTPPVGMSIQPPQRIPTTVIGMICGM